MAVLLMDEERQLYLYHPLLPAALSQARSQKGKLFSFVANVVYCMLSNYCFVI